MSLRNESVITPAQALQTQIEDITPFGEELSEEQLGLVAGGRPPHKSKVCDVGGGCWPDTGF